MSTVLSETRTRHWGRRYFGAPASALTQSYLFLERCAPRRLRNTDVVTSKASVISNLDITTLVSAICDRQKTQKLKSGVFQLIRQQDCCLLSPTNQARTRRLLSDEKLKQCDVCPSSTNNLRFASSIGYCASKT